MEHDRVVRPAPGHVDAALFGALVVEGLVRGVGDIWFDLGELDDRVGASVRRSRPGPWSGRGPSPPPIPSCTPRSRYLSVAIWMQSVRGRDPPSAGEAVRPGRFGTVESPELLARHVGRVEGRDVDPVPVDPLVLEDLPELLADLDAVRRGDREPPAEAARHEPADRVPQPLRDTLCLVEDEQDRRRMPALGPGRLVRREADGVVVRARRS